MLLLFGGMVILWGPCLLVLFCSALVIYWSRSASDLGVAESAFASCIICGSPYLRIRFVVLHIPGSASDPFCFALEGLLAFLLV